MRTRIGVEAILRDESVPFVIPTTVTVNGGCSNMLT